MSTYSRHGLWKKYGQPQMTDTADALRLLGKRDEIHPKDAVAFVYASQEAADAYAAANLEHHGHPTLGTYDLEEGVVGVLDLRHALEEQGVPATNPSEPDSGGIPDPLSKKARHA